MKKVNLNIACGDTFIKSDSWINLDFESNSKDVIQCDILKKIPFENNSIENIYSSHFVEHVSLENIPQLFYEFYRLLCAGGKIRVVTPDFEEMCRSYLESFDEKNYKVSDYIKHEILDQLVRNQEGGNLRKKFYNYLKLNDELMIKTVKERTGYNLAEYKDNLKKIRVNSLKNKFINIKSRLIRIYIKLISSLFPRAFKYQNISYTKVGENHKWIWDFNELKEFLNQAGFKNIKKKKFNDTDILNFPLELDMQNDKPRKGSQSMFVEAEK